MELKVINTAGGAAQNLIVSDTLLARNYNEALVHQVVTAFLANARSGNRAQKGRSDVQKSTRKPWRQKGTGRARAGMASSPLWRGGGKIFPSSPDENFSHKVNRKMYRAGICIILSQLMREERLLIVDALNVTSPKTKDFVQKMNAIGVDNALFITAELDESLYLASRNIQNVLVLEPSQVDPVNLVRFKKVVMTSEALQQFEEMLT